MKFVQLKEFVEKYITTDKKTWNAIELILCIKTYTKGEILKVDNLIYFINSGFIKCKKKSEINQTLDFYNCKKNKMFFNYSFCFVTDYLNLTKKEKLKQTFIVIEDSELVLIDYSKLRILAYKYKELQKFEEILLEFERNRIKKEIYKLLLEIDSY